MKIILTGSTGFIGQEVLLQCLSHPQITSLIVLSRRGLPISDPKLKVVLLEDFTKMPEDVLRELKGCEGCIWFVLLYISALHFCSRKKRQILATNYLRL